MAGGEYYYEEIIFVIFFLFISFGCHAPPGGHAPQFGNRCVRRYPLRDFMMAVCIVRRCIIRCGLIRIKNAYRLLSPVTSHHTITLQPYNQRSKLASQSPPPNTVM
ncbi:hypothetical protein J6590_028433 [Homalodisca vitripennis]|nr:hypothetical protein J6590_028433 [Homalodisca vitripennis]